ncbi:calcyclin-binding protein [Ischnura elegans]|uniref:calcyclin-binding protein n=1 Tax=Ischnura elegans TaxID=197161 RepID=UPI001ED8926A|nr:calcyclin-binding protein [Ischnura elegans]
MPVSKAEELREDLKELRQLQCTAQRHRVKDALSLEIRKIETELSKALVQESDLKNNPEASKMPATKCYEVKLNTYGWDQSENYVKIFVTLNKVQDLPSDQVFCTFTERSMEFNVKNLEGKNYILPIINLLEPINPEKSHWKVKTDKVVVFLAKKTVGKTWSHITGVEKREHESKTPKLGGEDESMAADPSDGLMNVLKQMYETGDDNMKRTIAQAWTQSQDQQMRGRGPNLGFD